MNALLFYIAPIILYRLNQSTILNPYHFDQKSTKTPLFLKCFKNIFVLTKSF